MADLVDELAEIRKIAAGLGGGGEREKTLAEFVVRMATAGEKLAARVERLEEQVRRLDERSRHRNAS